MRKHLRILYGCDDRYQVVANTVKVCENYFDTIQIINSGPEEFAEHIRSRVNVEVTQFNQFFEIESCRRAQIKDIPWNDWVMWLDADETPSVQLLYHLDENVDFCERNGIDLIRYYWSELTEGVHQHPFPNEERLKKVENVFAARRFIKRKPGIQLSSAFGAHEVFRNKNEKWIYIPYPMIHHKSRLQYYQSVTFSGFMNPTVHYDCNRPISDVLNTPEYKSLKAFQRRWKTFTSNDLVRKLKIEKNETYKAELKELFMSFPRAEGHGLKHDDAIITFKFMRNFAEDYDLNVESPYYQCGQACCKYGNIQL